MKKIICKLFGHKPTNERVIYESDVSKLKTFSATCKVCKCDLFGKEDVGEMSGELIKVFIKITP